MSALHGMPAANASLVTATASAASSVAAAAAAAQDRLVVVAHGVDHDLEVLEMTLFPETQAKNVAVLATVLLLALAANLAALPVILFRRTKFGNGLFAVLILCLTVSDVAVTFFSVLGSLIVEVSHFRWGGAPGSCQVYHWLSAWLTGLSAYLLVSIVGMVMVKTTTSCLQRLRDCRWLLLALLFTSALYALPELLVRTTADVGLGDDDPGAADICLLGASGVTYALYVCFRLTLRHVVPAVLVAAAIMRPETKLSKRVSHLFFGHLSAPCACGEGGGALSLPHECPNMQTAMLKAAKESAVTTVNGHAIPSVVSSSLSSSSTSSMRPATDSASDSEPIGFMRRGKPHKLFIQPEDPHRRRYKTLLAAHFLVATLVNFTLDVAFQIQSSTWSASSVVWSSGSEMASASHGENLATAMYAFAHMQQIGDPLIFLAAEFLFS